MTSLAASLSERSQFKTAIARMLGKAVKFRHCPATVSAPASQAVVSARAGHQPGLLRHRGRARRPLKMSPWLIFGKVAGEGASQETGPRRLTPACVPRGTKEPEHAAFPRVLAPLLSSCVPRPSLIRHSALLASAYWPSSLLRLDSRRRDRHLRRQGHRRQC